MFEAIYKKEDGTQVAESYFTGTFDEAVWSTQIELENMDNADFANMYEINEDRERLYLVCIDRDEVSPKMSLDGTLLADGCVLIDGEPVPFESAVNLMDDELREEVHFDLVPCSDQEFMDEYRERHYEKYGEDFLVN